MDCSSDLAGCGLSGQPRVVAIKAVTRGEFVSLSRVLSENGAV